MSLSQIRKKLLNWTESLHQKGVQNSNEQKSRSKGPKSRKLAIDLLEERQLLSISVGNASDLMINQPDPAATIPNYLGYETTPVAGNNQMSSGNDSGDFVTTWAQEEPAWVRNDDGSIMVDSEGNYVPFINPLTGAPYMESNIYARYFTDEVQTITIPKKLLDQSATGTSIGNFSLVYGGNEVQRITFATTTTPYTSYTQSIVGTFRIGGIKAHGENSPEDWVTVNFNESFGASYNAKLLQTALEGLGPYMKGVTVTPISSREFDIEFANDYWFQKDVPELQISTQSFSSGYLAGVEVTTVSEPLNITFYQDVNGVTTDVGIPIYVPNPNQRDSASAWNAAATQTANAITAAFAQYTTTDFYGPINSNVWVADEEQQSFYSSPPIGTWQVPEVRVTVVNTPLSNVKSSTNESYSYSFEITFVENSGKINHPELVMVSARDAGGNQFIDQDSFALYGVSLYDSSINDGVAEKDKVDTRPVTTIKETSDAFRVNPDEPDDPWTPGPDTTRQYKPVVAMDADGDFVIAWETEVNDPVDKPYDQYDIFARRFTTQSVISGNTFISDGKTINSVVPVGSTFQVNDYDNGIQTDPTIACDQYGNFVVAWTSYGQDSSYFTGVYARWYDRDGNNLSMDVQVSHETTMVLYDPRVAMSNDGHTVITWNNNAAPQHDLYKSVFAPGSTVAAEGLDAVLVHDNAIEASIAFDDNNRYLLTYTTHGTGIIAVGEIGMIEGRDVYGEMFKIGTTEVPNEDPDLPSTYVLSEEQTRSSFRLNSYDIGRGYTWHSQQLGSTAGIDADGDLFVGYQGFLPDADQMHSNPGTNVHVTFDYTDPYGYYYDHFVDGKNADLIPFFQRYGYTIYGIDVDAAIRDFLIPCWQNGATAEQLGRMNLIVESVLQYMRGASSDIGLTRIDADLNSDIYSQSDYLVSDSIINATRDGSNTRFYIAIPKTPISSGTLQFRVSRSDSIGDNFTDISITIAVDGNSKSVILGDTMDNIRNAFNAAWILAAETWQGDDTDWECTYVQYISIEADDDGPYAWSTYRQDTPWEVPFSAFPDYNNSRYQDEGWHIFEVTLTNGAHDTMINISYPPGSNMGAIRWDGDNNDTYAVNCVAAPPSMYGSYYETYGNPGTSQLGASIVVATSGSYTMTWAQEIGKTSSYYPSTVSDILSYMTPNYSMYPQTYFTGIFGTSRAFTQSNLFYRNFVESTDTAGPKITDYLLPDGSHIAEGDQVTYALQELVVVFDEQMLSTLNYGNASAAERGIENVKNWILLKDGVEVQGGIEKVEFGLNASQALAEKAYLGSVSGGTLANGTNKWEAIVTFKENGVNHSLSGGQYTLVCKRVVVDMAGNVLNRNGIHQSGADATITFNVSIMDGYLGFNPDEVDDKNFNSDEHVSNEQSSYYVGYDEFGDPIRDLSEWYKTHDREPTEEEYKELPYLKDSSKSIPFTSVVAVKDAAGNILRYEQGETTYVDPQYGEQTFREDEYTMDTEMESSGRTVASDAEGNFAVVWVSNDPGNEGVFVRKYRTTTIYGLNGESSVDETIDIIRLSDSPTAKQATIAMDADGDIVVAWAEEVFDEERGVYSYDIVYNYLTEEQVVDTYGSKEFVIGGVLRPKFFTDWNGDGKFDPRVDTPTYMVNSDNTRISCPIANTEREYAQQHPSIAMNVEGDFVIVWESDRQDGSGWGVFGQRFAPDCSKLGGLNCVQEIQISGSPSGGSFKLSYVRYEGDTQLMWETEDISINQNTFAMQENILNALHNMVAKTSAAIAVAPILSLDVEITVVSMARILVEFTGDEYGNKTQPQLIVTDLQLENPKPGQNVTTITSVDGNSGEFQVNLTTEFDQRFPSVAMAQNGEFVVTWTGWSRTGSGQELYADVYSRKFVASSAMRLTGTQTSTGYNTNSGTPLIISNDDPANHEVQTGMGYDGVVLIEVYTPYGSWSGTGTLMSSGFHILTAAHVVCDEFGNPVDPSEIVITFHTTDDWTGNGKQMGVSQVFVHPTYAGLLTFTQTSDIAVLQLESLAPETAERYDIYRGRDELGKLMTKVGYGTAGTAYTGEILPAGTKRIGTNNYELLGQTYNASFNAELLLFDFDDGTVANDFFGNRYGVRNTGTGYENEVNTARGDSGGPGFVDGKIAGVTSGGNYVITPEGLEYTPPGSVSYDVRVSGYADWIDAIMSGGGNETRVNQASSGNQLWSDVAIDSDGSFVVTWTHAESLDSSMTLPPAYSIYARRFDSQGNPLSATTGYWGDEFLVSSVTAANSTDMHQAFSKISMTPMGDFVITWEGLSDRYNPGDGEYDYDIFARRYVNNRSLTTIHDGVITGYGLVGSNGSIGAQFNVNKTTEGNQRAASVALNSTGDMVFVWNGFTNQADPKYDDEGDAIYDPMDILYRRVTVPEDIGSPFVTDVISVTYKEVKDDDGKVIEILYDQYEQEQILSGMTLTQGPNKIIVTVSEEFYARYQVDSRSILNWNNWVLYKDGYILPGVITSETIKFNRVLADNEADYDPYVQGRNTAYHEGILDYRTGKIEIVFDFGDMDKNTAGIQGLANGEYILQFTANAEDVEGNKLDGNYDGRDGGNFQRIFYVGDSGSGSEVVNPDDPNIEPWNPTDPIEPGYETRDTPAYLENTQSIYDPAIAMRADGSFVVVSVENRVYYDAENEIFDTTYGEDIIVRMYDRNGNPIGTERIVNNYVVSTQNAPDVAVDDFGNFVVTWSGTSATSNTNGLHARVFDAFGNPASNQFQLTTSELYQATPKIAMNNDGTFMITWIGRDVTSDAKVKTDVVYAQAYSFNGTRIIGSYNGVETSGPVIVARSNDASGNCTDVDIACDRNGRYVITWSGYDSSNKTFNIFARTVEFNPEVGNFRTGSTFRVNTGIRGNQTSPAVDMNDNGDFVIVWEGEDADTKDSKFTRGEVFARAFDFGGSSISLLGTTSDCRINQYGVYEQIQPDVAFSGDGSRIVFTWTSFDQEVNNFDPNAGINGATQHDNGVYMRVLDRSSGKNYVDPSSSRLAGDIQVNRTQLGNQFNPVVAMDKDGDFTIAWVGPFVFYPETPYDEPPVFYAGSGMPTNVYIRSYRPNGIYSGYGTTSQATSTASSESTMLRSAAILESYTGLQQQGGTYMRPSGGGYVNTANIANSSRFEIAGTSGSDVLSIVPGTTSGTWVVTLNGKVQSVPEGTTQVVFSGNGGSDQITILGTEASETVIFDMDSRTIAFAGFGLNFVGTGAAKYSIDGAGGEDTITVTTSRANNDTLDLGFGEMILSGAEVLLTGYNFERVRAISGGGKDVAILRDSEQDDLLEMYSSYAYMSTAGYSHELSNFATVDAYSEYGNDTAIFYGSVMGNDTLTVNEYGATLSANDGSYWNRVKGFKNITAHGAGTSNTVVVEGSKKDSDTLVITDDNAEMNYGNGTTVNFDGFQNATVNAGSNFNKAFVNSTSRFVGYDDHCVFTTGATSYQLNQFDETVVYASQGQSSLASLNISSGVTATIKSLGRSAVLNTGGLDLYTLIAFDQVLANKANGGRAGVIESAADYLFTTGNWD